MLPLEIINEILFYIADDLTSLSLTNADFKMIVSNYQKTNGIVVIISRKMMENFVKTTPDMFSCMIIRRWLGIYSLDREYYNKVAEKKSYRISGRTFIKSYSSVRKKFANQCVYYPSFDIQMRVKNIFLPSAKIILFFLKNHKYFDKGNFGQKSLTNTRFWYINKIKESEFQSNEKKIIDMFSNYY
jgi:hypothetical protein